MSQQAPAQPKSVLRGHRSQVHVTTFVRQNQRLASGDADGYVVLWDLTIMRPRAVWHAHDNAILGISDWGDDKIITEGRDNRLIVWKIADADEAKLSTALPLDESVSERPQPWILYILEISTMNFCSFSSCPPSADVDADASSELLIAVPNTLQTEAVDIFELASQKRLSTIHLGGKTEKKGMVMALSLFWLEGSLFVIAGYESGLAIVARREQDESWVTLYRNQTHGQPILSLGVGPDKNYFLTSGADAFIAKHPIPRPAPAETSKSGGIDAAVASPLKIIKTGHSGQQSLRIRSDGRIFATAGWDFKIRVYSTKTMAELAVLKWHDAGCYATAFSAVRDDSQSNATTGSTSTASGGGKDSAGGSIVPKPKETALTTIIGDLSVRERRIRRARDTHWLAAGSKDGKISLWDIY